MNDRVAATPPIVAVEPEVKPQPVTVIDVPVGPLDGDKLVTPTAVESFWRYWFREFISLLEVGVISITFRNHLHSLRPNNCESGIVPPNSARRFRVIKLRHLIEDFRIVF